MPEFDFARLGWCGKYCSHGGMCTVRGPHTVHSSSGTCEFTDAEAITKVEADAIVIAEGNGLIVDVEELLWSLLEALDSDDQ